MNNIEMTKRAALFALGLGLCGGCASHEKIVFSDEPEVQAAIANAKASAPAVTIKRLAKPDQQAVEQLVFGDLLGRNLVAASEYSAVFIQADDPQVTALMQQFPQHQPPIKMSIQADLRSKQKPLDKDTGKPALILSAEAGEVMADDSVTVIGRWSGVGATSGSQAYVLKKTGDQWQIVSGK